MAAICRRRVVTSPTSMCSFFGHPPRPVLENKCYYKLVDTTEKKIKDIRAWHTFYPFLFVAFYLIRKSNKLEKLLGIGSWSRSVQGGRCLVVIRFTDDLDMNICMHAILVKVFI